MQQGYEFVIVTNKTAAAMGKVARFHEGRPARAFHDCSRAVALEAPSIAPLASAGETRLRLAYVLVQMIVGPATGPKKACAAFW